MSKTNHKNKTTLDLGSNTINPMLAKGRSILCNINYHPPWRSTNHFINAIWAPKYCRVSCQVYHQTLEKYPFSLHLLCQLFVPVSQWGRIIWSISGLPMPSKQGIFGNPEFVSVSPGILLFHSRLRLLTPTSIGSQPGGRGSLLCPWVLPQDRIQIQHTIPGSLGHTQT